MNWTNALTGATCGFTKNDYSHNVYFSDRHTTQTTINTSGETIRPGNVVFDIDDATTGMTLNFQSSGLREHVKSFVKRGAGVLKISRTNGSNKMYCGMDVEAGRVELRSPNCGANSIIGYQASNTTITVASGAELRACERGAIAAITAANRTDGSFGARISLDGGTFGICENLTGSHTANAIKDLTFSGGTLYLAGYGAADISNAILRVADKVTVTGATAPTIAYTNLKRQRWLLDFEHPTEFAIEDLDGGSQIDFDFPLYFANYASAGAAYPNGALLKTGAGTMRKTSYDDAFASDIEIREGTFLLDHDSYSSIMAGHDGVSFLGNLNLPDRQILVTQTGTLKLNQRIMLDSTPSDATAPLTPIVMRNGGTLELPRAATPNTFGPLEFDDGNLSYGGSRDDILGMIGVGGTVKVKGTKTVSWPTAPRAYWYLLPNYVTIFEVADISGDGAVDLDFGPWLTMPVVSGAAVDAEMQAACGFTKTGAGTMRLSANQNLAIQPRKISAGNWVNDLIDFRGEARVNAGTLQVDGVFASNLVVVASGAFLSGTGTVGRATLADGAGFSPRVGCLSPLKVLGDLTVGTSGTLNVLVDAASADTWTKVDIAEVNGEVVSESSEPFANWSLTVNGKTTSASFRVTRVGKVLRCKIAKGMCIYVR